MGETTPSPRARLLLAALIALCFAPSLLGWRFPDPWWGAHVLSMLPRPWAMAVFGASLLTVILFPLLVPADRSIRLRLPARLALTGRPVATALLVAAAFGVACHLFDMSTDIFGDARRNLKAVEMAVARGNPDWARALFNPNLLFREGGDHLVINLAALLSAGLDISAKDAFGLINALCGFLFAFVWSLFILRTVKGGADRLLLVLVGLASGLTPLFTDHAEVYAPAAALLLLFLVVTVRCLRERSRPLLAALALLFLVAAKTHFANLLLALPLLLAALELFAPRLSPLRSRRRAAATVALPLIALFLILYFGVMKNHAVSRFVDDAGRAATFFLPLANVEAAGMPVYTLLSPAHFADYLNAILLWSTPALLIVLSGWLFRRPRLASPPAEMVLLELMLPIYAGVFFATNPVLGMPRDWDLFMLPAAPLLVYAGLLVGRTAGDRGLPRTLFGGALGLVILSSPLLAVHHVPRLTAGRVESMGVITYKRYWKGAAYMLNVAATLGDVDDATELKRRVASYGKIRPWTLELDPEQADLALRISRLYRKGKDYRRARPYALDAMTAGRGDGKCVHEMALVQFGLGEFDKALLGARTLCEYYPDDIAYLELAFKSACRLGRWEEALAFGERYLSRKPNDAESHERIARIRAALSERGGEPD